MGLFGGKPDASPAVEAPPRPRAQAETVPTRVAEAPTVLGKNAIVKGELISDADVLVEGRVEGKIQSSKRVIIGENGDVEARVEAEIITIRGKVHGDCEATKKVEITASGKVFGNIAARAIVVAEGATFRGSSKMTPDAAKEPLRPRPPAPEPAPGEQKNNAAPNLRP